MEKSEVSSDIYSSKFIGDGIVDAGVMFSAKTHRIKAQIESIIDRNRYRSPKNQIRYVVINNSTDTSVQSGTTYSRRSGLIDAITISRNDPNSAIDILHELDEQSKETIPIVFIDEVQFLPIKFMETIFRFKNEKRRQWIAGLSKDFRGEKFETMDVIKEIFSFYVDIKPNCTFDVDGEQCGQDASNTVRVIDNANYPLKTPIKYYKSNDDGSNREIKNGFFAPYWDKTILPRDSKGIDYTVVCEEHFKVPRTDETKQIYEAIKKVHYINKNDLLKNFNRFEDLEQILGFLSIERNIKIDGDKYIFSYK